MKYLITFLSVGFMLTSAAQAEETPKDLMAVAKESRAVQLPMYVTEDVKAQHLFNMRGAFERLQGVVVALAEEDFDAALKAFKPRHQHQGLVPVCLRATEGAPEMRGEVQRNMKQLKQQLMAKDLKASLAAVGSAMEACSACHNTYTHKIISQKEWDERAKALGFE